MSLSLELPREGLEVALSVLGWEQGEHWAQLGSMTLEVFPSLNDSEILMASFHQCYIDQGIIVGCWSKSAFAGIFTVLTQQSEISSLLLAVV